MDDSLPLSDAADVQARAGPSGSDLAARAAAGDAAAFEALVLAYQRRVYGFAHRYLRGPDEAADLTQEIFLRLFRKLDRYDPARPFEPWFWRLAARVSADFLERLGPKRREVPLDDCAPQLSVADAASTRETPLGSALARLPTSYRLHLLLRYELDLGLQEIAEVTRSTVPAVKSRLHRARLELQRELLEGGT